MSDTQIERPNNRWLARGFEGRLLRWIAYVGALIPLGWLIWMECIDPTVWNSFGSITHAYLMAWPIFGLLGWYYATLVLRRMNPTRLETRLMIVLPLCLALILTFICGPLAAITMGLGSGVLFFYAASWGIPVAVLRGASAQWIRIFYIFLGATPPCLFVVATFGLVLMIWAENYQDKFWSIAGIVAMGTSTLMLLPWIVVTFQARKQAKSLNQH